MKVGDKLICKKTLFCDGASYFTIGSIYSVMELESKDIVIKCNTGCIFSGCGFLKSNKDGFVENHHWLLFEYFYTEKEIRRMKLDKLK